jgi:hypothetical protein
MTEMLLSGKLVTGSEIDGKDKCELTAGTASPQADGDQQMA